MGRIAEYSECPVTLITVPIAGTTILAPAANHKIMVTNYVITSDGTNASIVQFDGSSTPGLTGPMNIGANDHIQDQSGESCIDIPAGEGLIISNSGTGVIAGYLTYWLKKDV